MRLVVAPLLLVAVAAAGCAAPLTTGFLSGSQKQESAAESQTLAADAKADDAPRSAAVRKAMGEPPVTQDEAFAGILQELQEIRAIDPTAEAELMADLRAAKPEHYPMIVETFRTALAYRQQLAERQQRTDQAAGIVASDEAYELRDSQPSAELDYESQRRAIAVRASLASAKTARDVENETSLNPQEAPLPRSQEPKQPRVDANLQQASTHAIESPSPEPVVLRPAPTTETLAPVEPQTLQAATPIVTPVAVGAAGGDWQTELTAAIGDLQRKVNPQPSSVDELQQHMRLRTLQLLAGCEEDAYRPIPGASPAQQDYWSKQLFAISAYLDHGGKLDDKQRAVAALAPLDEARAKLSELATLQIRNAAFVTSVDGFGAYETVKDAKFQPGDKAMVYVEVENFTSDAREDGHHTSLGTSYQVVDETGRRVDAKQFPDVADRCRNRRRDFHMQYQLAVPTRIYPGQYQLELTITDHNSGKIGQTTLPFEIAAER